MREQPSELADHIRRCQKRSDDEDEENGVAPLLLQEIRGHHAHSAEEKGRYRKLKDKAESKEQLDGKEKNLLTEGRARRYSLEKARKNLNP